MGRPSGDCDGVAPSGRDRWRGPTLGLLLPQRPARCGNDALAGSSDHRRYHTVHDLTASRPSNGSWALPHHVRAGTRLGSVQARLSG